jgi:hypothetical protein
MNFSSKETQNTPQRAARVRSTSVEEGEAINTSQ